MAVTSCLQRFIRECFCCCVEERTSRIAKAVMLVTVFVAINFRSAEMKTNGKRAQKMKTKRSRWSSRELLEVFKSFWRKKREPSRSKNFSLRETLELLLAAIDFVSKFSSIKDTKRFWWTEVSINLATKFHAKLLSHSQKGDQKIAINS